MVFLHPLDRLRLEHGSEHLHSLGARATAEFLAEIARKANCLPIILEELDEYKARISPDMLFVTRGNRFPPRRPLEVPR